MAQPFASLTLATLVALSLTPALEPSLVLQAATAPRAQAADTLYLEVGSPEVDARVYRPHAARVRVRIGDSDQVTSEWTNELSVADSAGRPVMRWVTLGRNGSGATWELRQTYDGITLAPLKFHSLSSTGAELHVSIEGGRVRGTRRQPGDATVYEVDEPVERLGFFAGASDLVPAAVGMRTGRVMVAPVWRPQWRTARDVVFTVVGRTVVDVEGTPVEAWRVEEHDRESRALTATWYLLESSPYMVYGEVPLEDGRIQRMSEVEIPRSGR